LHPIVRHTPLARVGRVEAGAQRCDEPIPLHSRGQRVEEVATPFVHEELEKAPGIAHGSSAEPQTFAEPSDHAKVDDDENFALDFPGVAACHAMYWTKKEEMLADLINLYEDAD
jgi:hypothetical protein